MLSCWQSLLRRSSRLVSPLLALYVTIPHNRSAVSTLSFFTQSTPQAIRISTTVSKQLKAAHTTHAAIIIWRGVTRRTCHLLNIFFIQCYLLLQTFKKIVGQYGSLIRFHLGHRANAVLTTPEVKSPWWWKIILMMENHPDDGKSSWWLKITQMVKNHPRLTFFTDFSLQAFEKVLSSNAHITKGLDYRPLLSWLGTGLLA